MTYIFGNIIHQESEEDFVKKLNAFGFKKSDRFVHLNRCVSFRYGIEFFKGKTNYSMHNWDSKFNSPIGLIDMLDSKQYFKESVFCRFRMHRRGRKYVVEDFNVGDVVNQLIASETDPRYIYPPKGSCAKPFTIGFYAYFFWRKYFGDDVALVNFYGPSDPTYNAAVTEKWHDYVFEHRYLDSIKAQKIFI